MHPAFRWANTMHGNIKSAILATYRAVRKKNLVARWPSSSGALITASTSQR